MKLHLPTLVRRRLRSAGFDLVRWSPPRRQAVVCYPTTRWLDALRIRTILDIGANDGQFARTMLDRHGGARIYSFEPLSASFAALQSQISDSDRFRAFNIALGDSNSEMEINRSEYSPSSSILPMTKLHQCAFPRTASRDGSEIIQVCRLDDVAEKLNFEEGIFVKIDVQGFEAHVVRGGQQTLKRAKAMIVETSFQTLYEGQPLFDDIYQMLKAMGFTYAGNWDQLRDPRTGRFLQADCIFLRDVPAE